MIFRKRENAYQRRRRVELEETKEWQRGGRLISLGLTVLLMSGGLLPLSSALSELGYADAALLACATLPLAIALSFAIASRGSSLQRKALLLTRPDDI